MFLFDMIQLMCLLFCFQADDSYFDISTSNEFCLIKEASIAILVDNGSQMQFGIERILRGKAEKEIARNCKFKSERATIRFFLYFLLVQQIS